MYQANIFFDYLKIVLKNSETSGHPTKPSINPKLPQIFFCDKNLSYLFVRQIRFTLCLFSIIFHLVHFEFFIFF